MLLALVFGAIFVTVMGALSSYVLSQNAILNFGSQKGVAFSIAEAGIEYYRWHLAHYPSDLQNGTGQAGPYVIPYNDPEGGQVGTITLEITGNTSCNLVTSVDIRSTGTPTDEPGSARTIRTRYAQPTVALYSYIVNDSVWAGADRVINGPYHSNGGVRMDGTANSSVTSSLSSWLCTSSFGCSPSQTKPGVWGSGPSQNLWNYPVPQVDFAGIAADFAVLKTTAQATGIYLPRYSSGNSNGSAYWRGYHLIFNVNGTVTVRRVTATTELDVEPINSADPDTDRSLINNETNYNTYTIPSTCGLIFVEDNVWVEGTIPQKVTLVAANVTTTGVAPNAYLRNNIAYGTTDGTDGLTLIAENNILIAANSPTNLTLNGIFIAQGGAFGRNLYDCPSSYEPRGTLTIRGTTVSNKRTGTQWENGCGWSGDAGYQTRVDAFDRQLATDPPPFTPIVSTDYEFVDWREQ
jgi:hypothetical protein